MRDRQNVEILKSIHQSVLRVISGILINKGSTIVLGIASCEGEEVSKLLHYKFNKFNILSLILICVLFLSFNQVKLSTIENAFTSCCDQYEAQIVVLAAQFLWTEDVEAAFQSASSASEKLTPLERALEQLEAT